MVKEGGYSPFLEESLGIDHVLTDGAGLPRPVGTRGIDLIERRAGDLVEAGDEEGDAKRADTAGRDGAKDVEDESMSRRYSRRRGRNGFRRPTISRTHEPLHSHRASTHSHSTPIALPSGSSIHHNKLDTHPLWVNSCMTLATSWTRMRVGGSSR